MVVNMAYLIKFSRLGQDPDISAESFEVLRNQTPKRKRFCDLQGDIVVVSNKEGDDGCYINLGFKESIGPILQCQLGGHCFPKNDGKFGVRFEIDKKPDVDAFVTQFNRTVFIRSLLSCCVALDMTFETSTDENSGLKYTEVGLHEHSAKEENAEESILFLKDQLTSHIRSLSFYRHADGLACIPPSTGKETCLPKILAQQVASELEIEDFTERLIFKSKDSSLQTTARDKRWGALDSSGLEVDNSDSLLDGKVVILLDDLYQSGATMHYVGKALKDSGVRHVLGLTIVKSRSDTDNG